MTWHNEQFSRIEGDKPDWMMPHPDPLVHKIRCQTYHIHAIRRVVGDNFRPETWILEQSREISRLQAEARKELGL